MANCNCNCYFFNHYHSQPGILLKALRHADKHIISLTSLDKIKVMDELAVTPPLHPPPPLLNPHSPLVSFLSPPAVDPSPALQVQISCCLLHVNSARHKPFDWLNFHSSTKGKNAFLLMINGCKRRQALHFHGIYFHWGDFSPFIFQLPSDTVIHHSPCDKGRKRVHRFRPLTDFPHT